MGFPLSLPKQNKPTWNIYRKSPQALRLFSPELFVLTSQEAQSLETCH